jgi:hypothetical protein
MDFFATPRAATPLPALFLPRWSDGLHMVTNISSRDFPQMILQLTFIENGTDPQNYDAVCSAPMVHGPADARPALRGPRLARGQHLLMHLHLGVTLVIADCFHLKNLTGAVRFREHDKGTAVRIHGL